MFKLLSVLAAGMFLTLLIGGENKGQTRQGLAGVQAPADRPVLRKTAANTAPAAAVTPDVTLANFAPVVVQKPSTQQMATATIAGSFVVQPVKAEAVAAVTESTPEVTSNMPVMYVSSSSVNVRQGPSTDYDVVGRLTRAEAVTIVSPEEDGWVQISIEGDGLTGFIAARLLTDTDPAN
jgi:uncharacterized protein YgiM (DUF1202 family)